MERHCVNCGDELVVHQGRDQIVTYCTTCGTETKEACAPRAPQWDRAPVKRVSTIAQLKPKERADSKIKKMNDRGGYVPRRGAK